MVGSMLRLNLSNLRFNFESAFHFCQLAYPLLKASGAGCIVFVSSVAGVLSLNIGSIYGATKGTSEEKLNLSNPEF